MFYRVYFDTGCNEGYWYEDFDDFTSSLQFAEKQTESQIVKYDVLAPLSYNVKLIY